MSIAPDLATALAYSRYATAALAAHPEEGEELAATLGAPFAWADAEAALSAAAEAGEPRALAAALRGLRRRVFVHTLARDLTARADLPEVCASMSTLAEVALRAAVTLHHRALAAGHGEPRDENGAAQDLVVIGMGKLGGRELNVSSDVDLVFVYPEDGDTDGARPLSNREFFERLGRRVIGALHDVTPDGYVFRVDMRLRPYGESGPLAVPYSALEQYLITQGRAWERYAWLKARALTGTRHDELYALVTPFVFRKYLDYDAYDGLRDVHRQIAEQGKRRDYAPNIKLGPGGIREIEFIAQALQIVRGGREPELRARGTLPALAAIAARGLMPAAGTAALRDAYVYLRDVEHRLQYRDDRQTQTLPADAAERDALARTMGCADGAAFDDALAAHRTAVAAQFAGLFGAVGAREADTTASSSAAERNPALPALAALWSDDVAADTARQTLAAAGFADPDGLLASLTRVRASPRYVQLPALSRQRVDALVPQLLAASASMPAEGADAQAVFHRLFELLEAISRRSAYLALLTEHPTMLPRLAQLMGASQWAADYLTRHPILLDELLDPRVLLAEPDWEAWRRELARLLAIQAGDVERADGRGAPVPARADVPAARAGPRRYADGRASRRPSFRARRRHPRGNAGRGLGPDGGSRRAAAEVRDRRLRKARRQGAGLRVRPRPRFPLRRRRRVRAGPLHASRAAARHLAHERDRRRTPLRHRSSAAPRRRGRPDDLVARRLPPLRARAGLDLGASGAHARAIRRRRRDDRGGVRGRAQGDPVPAARAREAQRRRRRHAAEDARRPLQPDASLRPQARRREEWSTSSSRSSISCSRMRTTTPG